MSVRQPFPDIQQWDNVRLAEVWREFLWFCAQADVTSTEQMSERNKRVYAQLQAEQARRGVQLSLL
jgi:hypothetical protein